MTVIDKTMAIASMLVAASGCGGEGQNADPLPSAPFDDAGKDLISLRLLAPDAPCGYDWSYAVEVPDDGERRHLDYVVTYDERGRAVLHEGRNDDGELEESAAFEYGDGPDWVHSVWMDLGTTVESWQAFDSFGRKIRYSGDDDGDGSEDWLATYAYGGSGDRESAHLEFYGEPQLIYDRAYLYDATERLVEIDRDEGPDGTNDRTTRIDYDDGARVIDQTTTDAEDRIIEKKLAQYDDSNRLVHDSWRFIATEGGGGTYDQDWTYSYDGGGRLRQQVFLVATAGDAAGDFQSRLTTVYRYGDCR